jgi:acetolactate synthase-1/2/3 large subunit
MKLSDYVIEFLAARGVTHFFGISGGAAVHLFDSVAKNPRCSYICVQHEQSAATAADGFARTTGKIGAAITTSGPGATNLLTGVCSSYYDSVPTFMITGQVATFRLKGNRRVRQVGFQETDVPSIYKSVTKYAVQVESADQIRYHMEKAYYLALEGRPGPVLIDLPDDLQRAEIDPAQLVGFQPEPIGASTIGGKSFDDIQRLLRTANRPILVLGGGLKTPPIQQSVISEFVDRIGVPTLVTWAAVDVLPADHPLRVGTFGVYGPRPGNFAIQNADFVLAIGTRLSQNVTGGILSAFAREATIAMVDVDPGEMTKFAGRGIDITYALEAKAADFMNSVLESDFATQSSRIRGWTDRIGRWQAMFPLEGSIGESTLQRPCVDAYAFIDRLSKHIPADETIVLDTGGNLTWCANGLKTKTGQRVFSAWNNTPMGYALPAAIGALVGAEKGSVTCVTGDGGLMLSLGELAVLKHHQLNIRVILFNNHGHGIQKQTIETWLGGRYQGVDPDSGLAFPDLPEVCRAMGLPVVAIDCDDSIDRTLAEVYSTQGPVICNVEIHPDQKLYPVLKFGSALEDQLPSLPADLIRAEMLVAPFEPVGAVESAKGGAGV